MKEQTSSKQTKIILLLITIIALLLVIISQMKNKTNIVQSNSITSTQENRETVSSSEETKVFLPTVKTLSTCTYKVGTDIAAGIYNLTAESGTGLITGDLQEGYLSEMMGIMEDYEEYYSETYKNLFLKQGDKFEISGGVTIEFVPIS